MEDVTIFKSVLTKPAETLLLCIESNILLQQVKNIFGDSIIKKRPFDEYIYDANILVEFISGHRIAIYSDNMYSIEKRNNILII